MSDQIQLKVNDKEVPMNPFVKKAFSNVIEGLVDSLDKLPDKINRIEIMIKKEETK